MWKLFEVGCMVEIGSVTAYIPHWLSQILEDANAKWNNVLCLFSSDLHIIDFWYYAVLLPIFKWSPYHWFLMQIATVSITYCGDYPYEHYFYVPWLIMTSQCAMMLQKMYIVMSQWVMILLCVHIMTSQCIMMLIGASFITILLLYPILIFLFLQ